MDGVRFLSPEWLEELAAAGAQDAGNSPVVVQQLVDTVDGEIAYWLEIGTSGTAVGIGAAKAPTVTFRQDEAVAATIAHGERSALDAFMQRDLELTGDVDALIAAQALLADRPDPFADLRSRTVYA